jgi:hypothetical protein
MAAIMVTYTLPLSDHGWQSQSVEPKREKNGSRESEWLRPRIHEGGGENEDGLSGLFGLVSLSRWSDRKLTRRTKEIIETR